MLWGHDYRTRAIIIAVIIVLSHLFLIKLYLRNELRWAVIIQARLIIARIGI